MEPEYKSNSKIGILGAGPSGCCAAYFLQDKCDVTLIDYSIPLRTILPTGGGRCNLAHAEFDFRELVNNYPRGEKFLYSIFSKFSTPDTIEMFENIGIKTYIQPDNRIFPESNSSKDVQNAFMQNLKKVTIKREKGLRIEPLENKIKLVTDMDSYIFDSLIVAMGGHNGYEILKRIGIDIVPPTPALVGLSTSENLKSLAGVPVSNAISKGLQDDFIFTHQGVSGPLIYKVSSINTKNKFPYNLSIDLYPENFDLQTIFNENPHKQINNLLTEFLPKKLANYIVERAGLQTDLKCHNINGKQRDLLLNLIHNFTIQITGVKKDGEVVTAGGVNLNEVYPKTLESKKIKNLYFIGEILDIDGLCGGFNLQNCWSTAFVAASAISIS